MVIICVRNCVLRINAANVGNVGYNLHSRTARRSHWQNDDGKSAIPSIMVDRINSHLKCLPSFYLSIHYLVGTNLKYENVDFRCTSKV